MERSATSNKTGPLGELDNVLPQTLRGGAAEERSELELQAAAATSSIITTSRGSVQPTLRLDTM